MCHYAVQDAKLLCVYVTNHCHTEGTYINHTHSELYRPKQTSMASSQSNILVGAGHPVLSPPDVDAGVNYYPEDVHRPQEEQEEPEHLQGRQLPKEMIVKTKTN